MKALFKKITNESDNLKGKGSNAANNAVFLCLLKILAEKICYIITMTGRCRRLSSLPYPFHGIVTLQHMFRRLFRDKDNVGLLFRKGTSHMINPIFSIEQTRSRAKNLCTTKEDQLESIIDIVEPLLDAHTALSRILTFQEETLKVKDGKQIIDTIKQSLEMINHACNLSHACTEEILAGTNA